MVTLRRIGNSSVLLPLEDAAQTDRARIGVVMKTPPSVDTSFDTAWKAGAVVVCFRPKAGRDWVAAGTEWLTLASGGSNRRILWHEPAQPMFISVANDLARMVPFVHLNFRFRLDGAKTIATADGIAFTNANQEVSVSFDGAAPSRIGPEKNTTVMLPLGGPRRGQLVVPLQLVPATLASCGAAPALFEVTAAAPAAETSVAAKHHPVFRLKDGKTPISAELLFDPLEMENETEEGQRTFIEFARGHSLGTHLRTSAGHDVHLTPREGARLRPTRQPRTYTPKNGGKIVQQDLAFLPQSSFELSVHDAAGKPVTVDAELVCGSSTNDGFTFAPGDVLEFTVEKTNAAFVARKGIPSASGNPVADADVAASEETRLTELAHTSWARVIPAANRRTRALAQPDDASLYVPSENVADDATATPGLAFKQLHLGQFTNEVKPPAVPLFPVGGVQAADAATALAREASLVSPKRRELLGNAPKATDAQDAVGDTYLGTTPQGLLLSVEDGAWKTVTLAETEYGNERRQLKFTNVDATLKEELQRNKVFLAMEQLPAGLALDGDVGIANWPFKLDLSKAPPVQEGAPPRMLLIKFGEKSIRALVEEAKGFKTPWVKDPVSARERLAAYIKSIEAKKGEPGMGALWDALNSASWNGILALNWSLQVEDVPDQVSGLMGGFEQKDLDRLHAAFIGIAANDIERSTDAGRPPLSIAKSSLFGLVDYSNPADPQPGDKEPFKFKVTQLRLVFQNSEIKRFDCKLKLAIGELFKQKVDTQVITFDGRYERHNEGGVKREVYSFTHEKEYRFKLGAILEEVVLQKLAFTSDKRDGADGSKAVACRFSIWGYLKFGELNEGLDLFSFDRLQFDDLGLNMRFKLKGKDLTITSGLAFDPGTLQLKAPDEQGTKSRGKSLFAKFPLKLKSFLFSIDAPDIDVPALGFVPIGVPGAIAAKLQYALTFDFDLGSLGKLVASSAAQLKSELLLGWTGNGFAVGLKFPESSGGKKEFGLQGIAKLTVESLEFKRLQDLLVLRLVDCQLEVLGKKLPDSGTFSMMLFVPNNAERKLGWFGGWVADPGDETGLVNVRLAAGGQRVMPDASTAFDAIEKIREALKNHEKPAAIKYTGEGWTLGAELAILDVAIRLRMIISDPSLYGVHIVAPDPVGTFEIAYRKLADGIGVFSLDLAIPVRQFEVGAASVTLPNFGISLYSNGDFKVDIGFPRELDFTRSMRVQIGIFIGHGGMYIAKLSGKTSDMLRGAPVDLVLQAGFALRVGLGREIQIGPLSGGISITVFGILEGALGYKKGAFQKNPFDPEALALRGRVGLIGEIYGTVSFAIVKAHFNIRIYAQIGVALRTAHATVLWIEAGVTVRVTVVIGSFKIFGKRIQIKVSFSFSATVRAQWTLGEGPPAMDALSAGAIDWGWAPATGSKTLLPLWLSAEGTLDEDGGDVPRCVVLLSVQRAEKAGDPETPFDRLAVELLTWTVQCAFETDSPLTHPVSEESLRLLEKRLHLTPTLARPEGTITGLDYARLTRFLDARFDVVVQAAPEKSGETAGAFFPLMPDVTLRAHAEQLPHEHHRPLWNNPAWDSAYVDEVARDVNEVVVNPLPQERPAGKPTAKVPMSQLLFQDYFDHLVKDSVHELFNSLVEWNLEEKPEKPAEHARQFGEVLERLRKSGRFAQLASKASRFFLHGGRLPVAPGAEQTKPLFELTEQQFPFFREGLPEQLTRYEVSVEARDGAGWFKTTDARIDFDSAGFEQLKALAAIQARPKSFVVREASYYRPQPRRFGLGAYVGTSRGTLYATPRALLAEAQRALIPGALKRGSTRPYDSASTPVSEAWSWVARVDFTVRRLTAGAERARVPNAYELVALTESNRLVLDALETAWPGVQPTVELCHRKDPKNDDGALVSSRARPTLTFASRTNLSDETNPDLEQAPSAVDDANVPFSATLEAPLQLAQILRKYGHVHSAGYVLRFQSADGADLPDSIFGTDGRADLSILFRWEGMKSDARPFFNAVEVAAPPASGEVLFFEASRLQKDELAIEPGCFAFEITRNRPDEQGTLADRVESVYHLVEYGLVGGLERLRDGARNPAIGPTEEGVDPSPADAATWRYEHVLPLADFAGGPYAAVGKTIELEFRVRDPYGNRLPGFVHREPFKVRYFDPLIPIAQWPGVRVVWRATAARTLQLEIAFDVEAVSKNPHNSLRDLAPAIDRVRKQLEDPRVVPFAWTSLESQSRTHALSREGLREFVDQLYRYVLGEVTTPPTPRITPFTVKVENPRDTFELQVELGLRRDAAPEWFDDHLKDMPELREVRARIPLDRDPANDVGARTRELAKAFEQELRWAYGLGSDGERALFAVRLRMLDGTTIPSTVSSGYAAPRPLSTSLRSAKSLTVRRFDPPLNKEEVIDVHGIDMDLQLRSMLSAIEWFLSPAYSVPARMLDSAAVDTVLGAKLKFAAAVHRLVQPVLATEAHPVDPARVADLFADRAKLDLHTAYDVDCALQLPVRTSPDLEKPQGARQPARLYGSVEHIVETDAAQKRVVLSTAKIELGEHPTLTVLVNSTAEWRQRAVDLKAKLRVTHVELPGDTGSRWLRLLQPHDILIRGGESTPVPIPLRQYPVLPSLTAHASKLTGATAADAKSKLQNSTRWDYQFDFEQEGAAQDTVDVAITYAEVAPSADSVRPDPLPHLVEHQRNWAAVSKELEALPRANAGSLPADGTTAAAVRFFTKYVMDAANALLALLDANPADASETASVIERLQLTEEEAPGGKPEKRLVRVIRKKDGALVSNRVAVVALNKDGTEIGESQTSSAAQASCVYTRSEDFWARRRISVTGLDAMRFQSASAAVSITRNDALLSSKQTNGVFLYRTPEIAFGEPLTPTLEFAEPFDLSGLSSKPMPLSEHFDALVDALFGSFPNEPRRIEIEGMYRFNLHHGAAEVLTRRRIFLLTPFEFLPARDKQKLAEDLQRLFGEWGKRHQPAKEGAFAIRLTVFASLGEKTQVPIYRATDLYVPLTKVSGPI